MRVKDGFRVDRLLFRCILETLENSLEYVDIDCKGGVMICIAGS